MTKKITKQNLGITPPTLKRSKKTNMDTRFSSFPPTPT